MNCKLTNQELQTHDGFQWELGKKEVIETVGGGLCSSDFFHYYSSPFLAVFLNPIHADIKNPRLFKIAVGGEILSDRGLKFGAKEMQLVEEIELPDVSDTQKIAFGILCALEVYKEPKFVLWATNWLDGVDRSEKSADAANAAASASAAAAYAAAAYAAAAYAARAAANAAYNAAAAYAANVDLIGLAKKAMEY